ncbi:YceI family protein [Flavobacterium sp. xlx-214]|uniref:YceI family protein n=1 Tax=unclassified Flavobacterium TaxID=196869 RepID=UPI0013D0CDAA|nr:MULTISPECIES: YceI family protein [unclassified Flavobacterium]MBA5792329.1 YceI family protein [Flavobacterium sp. xlx-221]QMI82356.1 YceI family protein [Flavobacterium sp. xlx-214]
MKKWNIDPTHSEIGFKVKHMMFTNVKGNFNDYSANIDFNEDLKDANLEFEAKVNSIFTNNADRDNHLKSADFFDVEQFPTLNFKSTEIKGQGNEYEISGDLTIKGVTKPIKLNAEFSGLMTDPWGNTKVGLNLDGKINRKDFGLTYNAALETGGVLVGEDIKLNAEIQLVEQK